MEKESKNDKIEKIRYSPFSMRLHENTIESLRIAKSKTGKSWNRFIIGMLNVYEKYETE